jgi:hypothetical protein
LIRDKEKREALEKTNRERMVGIGGGDAYGHLCQVNAMRIGSASTGIIKLTNVTVLLTKALTALRDTVLLGQRDFLDKVRFVQLPAYPAAHGRKERERRFRVFGE